MKGSDLEFVAVMIVVAGFVFLVIKIALL